MSDGQSGFWETIRHGIDEVELLKPPPYPDEEDEEEEGVGKS